MRQEATVVNAASSPGATGINTMAARPKSRVLLTLFTTMAIYEALDIRKERIDKARPWQNYIEAHFGIMRRIGDYYLNRATS